jgi:hypothetical protein
MTSEPIPDLSSIVSAAEHLKFKYQLHYLSAEMDIAY